MSRISLNNRDIAPSNANNDQSPQEKHADIVEYLKNLPTNVTANNYNIFQALGISLDDDMYLIDMLKSNPKVSTEILVDETNTPYSYNFQYVRPYSINNIEDLKDTIKKVRNGILFSDIENCYDSIGEDCKMLMVGGEDVIACKNKDKKTFALYPRGKPFYTRLSGTCQVTRGRSLIKTSESLLNEIRRGDSICMTSNNSWYRVSCSVGRGSDREQSNRSKAPLSVTSDKELSDKNVYYEPFTKDILPLDMTFDGPTSQSVKAKRHGCTLDIRKLWDDSLVYVKGHFRTDEEIEKELLNLNLISTATTITNPPVVVAPVQDENNDRKRKFPFRGRGRRGGRK